MKKTQVRILTSTNSEKLEKTINEITLSLAPHLFVLDIKYSHSCWEYTSDQFSAMIIIK